MSRTDITVTVQTFSEKGDGIGLPTIYVRDDYKFDNEIQAQNYYEELNNWLELRPIPDPELHPFPRKERRPVRLDAIDSIIDDMIVPECVHVNGDDTKGG